MKNNNKPKSFNKEYDLLQSQCLLDNICFYPLPNYSAVLEVRVSNLHEAFVFSCQEFSEGYNLAIKHPSKASLMGFKSGEQAGQSNLLLSSVVQCPIPISFCLQNDTPDITCHFYLRSFISKLSFPSFEKFSKLLKLFFCQFQTLMQHSPNYSPFQACQLFYYADSFLQPS
ncbi:hypothetical protein TNCV_1794981 [Trichonephila clavipes]|nr:hypothetical protein TNCV_1794981 [Trichonephila clavipes]